MLKKRAAKFPYSCIASHDTSSDALLTSFTSIRLSCLPGFNVTNVLTKLSRLMYLNIGLIETKSQRNFSSSHLYGSGVSQLRLTNDLTSPQVLLWRQSVWSLADKSRLSAFPQRKRSGTHHWTNKSPVWKEFVMQAIKLGGKINEKRKEDLRGWKLID